MFRDSQLLALTELTESIQLYISQLEICLNRKVESPTSPQRTLPKYASNGEISLLNQGMRTPCSTPVGSITPESPVPMIWNSKYELEQKASHRNSKDILESLQQVSVKHFERRELTEVPDDDMEFENSLMEAKWGHQSLPAISNTEQFPKQIEVSKDTPGTTFQSSI